MADDSKQGYPSGDGTNLGSDHDDGPLVTVDGVTVIFGESSELGERFFYMPGEVLVWADVAEEVAQLLRTDLGDDAEVGISDEGGLTFSKIEFASRFRPLDVVDLLSDRGYEAAPNHVLRMTSHITMIGVGLPRTAEPSENLKNQIDGAAPTKRSPVVAVVDTGIAKESSLPPTVVGVGNATELLTNPAATVFGHGTFVAGLIAAECPEAEIRVFRAAYRSDDSNGFGQLTDAQLAVTLEAVLEQADEVDILNLSLGGFTHDSRPLLASGSVIAELLRRDVTVVAGAGNDGRRGDPFYPAAQDGVLAIGSMGADGVRSCFSNRGSWVDVLAIGEDVVSTFPATKVRYPALAAGGPASCVPQPQAAASTVDFSAGWAMWSGTSFAAARVSGALARTRLL